MYIKYAHNRLNNVSTSRILKWTLKLIKVIMEGSLLSGLIKKHSSAFPSLLITAEDDGSVFPTGWPGRGAKCLQRLTWGLPFIGSPNTAALPHRKPATVRNSCGSQHDERTRCTSLTRMHKLLTRTQQ